MAVLTTTGADGAPHGMTVNSFTSVSCDPPIVSVSIGLRSSLLAILSAASRFGLSVLSVDQRAISTRFAGTSDARFDGIEWRPGPSGAPLIENVIATFECRKHSEVTVGDHVVIYLEVESAETFDGEPLLYFASRYTRLEP